MTRGPGRKRRFRPHSQSATGANAADPGRSSCGVRGAPWETALDNQPTAMTLLALEEVMAAVGGK